MTRPIAALKPFQTPAPPIAAADVPLPVLCRELAVVHVEERAARVSWWIAHPDDAPHEPAPAGLLAEYRHLLYDADEDSTVPAFPYPTPQETR